MKKKQIDDERPILVRTEFEKRFKAYRPAKRVVRFVTPEQMGVFFLIAEEYRRNARNLPALGQKKKALLDDAKSSKALMKGLRQRLNETLKFIQRSSAKPEQDATAILAGDALDQIATFQRRLDQEFEFEYRRIEALRRRLSTKWAQTSKLEFTLDLLGFVRNCFPQLSDRDKRNLMVAAMAGAESLTRTELEGGTEPGWVPERFSRAKQYQKKMYPEGRVYLHRELLVEKKQKVGAGEKKSG